LKEDTGGSNLLLWLRWPIVGISSVFMVDKLLGQNIHWW